MFLSSFDKIIDSIFKKESFLKYTLYTYAHMYEYNCVCVYTYLDIHLPLLSTSLYLTDSDNTELFDNIFGNYSIYLFYVYVYVPV